MLRTQDIRRFKKLKTYIPLAVAPALLLSATVQVDRLLAQSAVTDFTLPDSVPDGTTLNIDGDNSMAAINAVLTEQFAQKFNGAKVTANTSGTAPALQAVLAGDLDLAAIGRPLTDEEKAQGLVEIPVARHKIAIFVGPDNPHADDLKIAQFGQIFRGEISDWSELGGAAGPIRFIDRPATSDTRSAFRAYPVFNTAPFETGATADPVSEDTTDAVIEALGADGIGYAIADQVTDRSDIRILSMHSVPPTDQRYPFSQPLSYVYQGPQPNPAVQAFLGYATAPENAAMIETARQQAATGTPVVVAQSTTTPDTDTAAPAAGDGLPAEQPDAATPDAVTGGGDAPDAPPDVVPADDIPADASVEGAEPSDDGGPAGWWPWLLIPAAGGLLWWMLGKGGGAATGGAAGLLPPAAGDEASRLIMTLRGSQRGYAYWELNDRDRSQLRDADTLQLRLYEVSPDSPPERPLLKQVDQIDCDASAQDQEFTILAENKTYLTELGYEADGRWNMLVRSEPVHVPLAADTAELATAAAASSAAIQPPRPADDLAGVATSRGGGAASKMSSGAVDTAGSAPQRFGAVASQSAAVGGSAVGGAAVGGAWRQRDLPKRVSARSDLAEADQITLVPRSSQTADVHWEVSEVHKQALREAGGQILKLRIQDVTGINIDYEPPFSTQEYVCEETTHDRHVPIFVRDRDYIADLGYETEDGRWLRLIRSSYVRVE
ncbi:MAG: DUF4912 domain-containing protein [Cyanobacteria bacterium P01_A01_bin.114]